jgi:hypothetical protein
MGRYLIYTIALDPEGTTGHRNLAKMLVSSLLRTRFSGDIMVFHNSSIPLFMVHRAGVEEVKIDTPDAEIGNGAFAALAQSAKHRVARQIDHNRYDKIMFMDCDTIAIRNVDTMLQGEWDLAVFAEPGRSIEEECYGAYLTPEEAVRLKREGLNSGTWAVAASHFPDLIGKWREVEAKPPEVDGWFREQSAFNRVVLDWPGAVHHWSPSSIALPLCNHNHATYRGYTRATIVHAAGPDGVNYKLQFLFSAYSGAFLFDSQLALLNILEM